jgi:hypothetical protein
MAADVTGFNEGLRETTNSFNQMIDTIQGIQAWLSHSMDGFFNGLDFFSHLLGG